MNVQPKYVRATQAAERYGFGSTVWGELLKFKLVPSGRKISPRAHMLDVEQTDEAVAALLVRAEQHPGGLRGLINAAKGGQHDAA